MIRLTLTLLVCGFAAYRLARALTMDSITLPLRTFVYDRAFTGTPYEYRDQADANVKSRPWAWLYGLISCPFCAGWWFALGAYALWQWWDDSHGVIAAVAVAGVAAQLSARDQ